MTVTPTPRVNAEKTLPAKFANPSTKPFVLLTPEVDTDPPPSIASPQEILLTAGTQSERQDPGQPDVPTHGHFNNMSDDQPVEMPANSVMFNDASGDVLLAQAGASEFGAATAEEMGGGLAGGNAAAAGGLGPGAALLAIGAIALAGTGGGGSVDGGLTFAKTYQVDGAICCDEEDCDDEDDHHSKEIDVKVSGNIAIDITGTTYAWEPNLEGLRNGEFFVTVSGRDEITISWSNNGCIGVVEIEDLSTQNDYIKIEDQVFRLNWSGGQVSLA